MKPKHDDAKQGFRPLRSPLLVTGTYAMFISALFAAGCEETTALDCGGTQLVPYIPRVFDTDRLIDKPELLDSEVHLYEFMAVFVDTEHPLDFAYIDGKLYIDKDFAEDEQDVANMTQKARQYSRLLLDGQ